MIISRPWAFWRRVQYGTGFGVFWLLVFALTYFQFFYNEPTCFDQKKNGAERGVDCGGACTRICAFDVAAPTVKWARSFAVTSGQYNAVAYIENTNKTAAAPVVPYTLRLYDANGLIAERTGETILPPDSVYPVFEPRIDTGGRVPSQTFLELGEIETWVPAASGREQFSVNSRTLSGADASPRLRAEIYNNALTPATDVEVVATIFDARGNALTASRTFIDKFEPRSSQTAVFTWPEPIAKTIRSCEVPTDVALALDVSGSMNNDGGTPPEPITSVIKAAEAFAKRLRDHDQVSLVTFATKALLNNQLTANKTTVAKEIASTKISPTEERGSTNIGDAIVQGGNELLSERHNPEARKVLILLTDGLATAPDPNPNSYALEAANIIKASGVDIFTIGLGTSVDTDFIRKLASTNDKSFSAFTVSQVDGIYKTITGALCEDGAAVIEIIPKTKTSFTSLGQ